ncbi:hypothetical protein [Nitrosovibrio tenuis]|uniref:Peptidase propeptide and YPEB domain-containing protein n=1 Tax=Nitrosovibrio tenuis TaxID=1233 RepID=A0A1H7IM84_9PROT|nr:hypothetical protein [Nitrosovibrio tenuis]SEK63528.1 hypothetical protein SAMN05216387_102226 [Nitrosovibrio tenuis]
MKTKILTLVALQLTMAYAVSGFAGEGEELKWSQVPPTVQKTISENMGGGKIEEIKKETRTIGGKSITIYEAKVRKPGISGKKLEIEVDENGKLVELEDE